MCVCVCVCVCACVKGVRERVINLLTRDRMMDNGSLLSKYDRDCYTDAQANLLVNGGWFANGEWGPRGNGGDYELRG